MNETIKDVLISLIVVGLILIVGVPAIQIIDGNREGWFVPWKGSDYITCAGEDWVYFYPVVDSDCQRIGNWTLADGVYFDSSLAPCRVDYTVSWGVITSISKHNYG